MNQKTAKIAREIFFALLTFAIGLFAWVLWIDDDDASSNSAPAVVEPAIKPVGLQADTCTQEGAAYCGQIYAKKFRNDDLKRVDSRKRRIPNKMVRRLNRYAVNQAAKGIEVAVWWKHNGDPVLSRTECLQNLAPAGFVPVSYWCLRNADKPSTRRLNSRITKMKVACGGAAIIGYFGNGGIMGAGKGGASCVWGALAGAALK